MAASCLVRGTLFSLDVAARDCTARRRRTDAQLDETTVSAVSDIADDPEMTLQKKDRAEALRESLPRLSPEHREVIDLAYYHGKSVKEIADITGINEATVKTRAQEAGGVGGECMSATRAARVAVSRSTRKRPRPIVSALSALPPNPELPL
jgi:FixJ family two-component response regulator